MISKKRLMEKNRYGTCLYCRKKVLKKDLHDCPHDDCPMYDLCSECLEKHLQYHQQEITGMDEKTNELLNSIVFGRKIDRGGNKTGLF